MNQIDLRVSGMTCGGCVKSIQNALLAYDGIGTATANLEAATVSVAYDPGKILEPAIREAIENAGFDVEI